MRARRLLTALAVVVAASGATACRSEEVVLGFDPEVGAAYAYRYELSGTVTTSLEGEAPERQALAGTLLVDQTVVDVTAAGVLVEVEVRPGGGAPRSAVVLLDRAGSLRALQRIEGLPTAAFGLPAAASVIAGDVSEPPDEPLVLGETWTVDDGTVTGDGRLEALGVVDGGDVAEVATSLVQALDEARAAGGSGVRLRGTVRSEATTTFDLVDGAVRSATTTTRATVRATIDPPAGVAAEPVTGTIRFELVVRTSREG